ncbi:hypothetical protein BFP70_04580 [Thioclava sp. SK-1]|uniref:OmpA family protein n=1 Tax=Thioclava sp. SK-1 TaxID=1889770 RepID=UPI0008252230|nr:OmpA family protein [Thioclava sp. SK-1]OCX66507.1 hypothetical protein BFP70_04580 [Thioclava sp. SK-1]
MRTKIMTSAAFVFALVLSGVIAGGAATLIEKRSKSEVRVALETANYGWARVETDGLQVILVGTAPSEAERFRAVALAGTIVEASRVIDNTDVAATKALTPPEFSLEILRNDDGISLIGLIPASTDREVLLSELSDMIGGDAQIADMLETADYPVPVGWTEAYGFAVDTLATLPHSKISVEAGRVSVDAITASAADKARVETDLARRKPRTLALEFDISAPRPVITPFTLRFLIDDDGARFDACSADTETARNKIISAARAAGAGRLRDCTIGMGVPSPQWAEAAVMGIKALGELGAGSITYSDADIALIAPPTVSQSDFDRVVGELESDLPDVFSLKSKLETPEIASTQVAEFTAQLGAGKLSLRGRVTDELQRSTVESYARAQFGTAAVRGAMRVDENLPSNWPVRVLAGLSALDLLNEGALTVRPDLVSLSGISGNPKASDDIARLFADRLGESAQFDLSIRYDKRLDPILGLPSGRECVDRLNAVLAKQKITFEPGSSKIDTEGTRAMEALAQAMTNCEDYAMELSGHTDSQGGEQMNQQLSQQRADSVRVALSDAGVLVSNITTKGYGEAQPIAGNDTEDGREANRRIEFVLLDEAPVAEAQSELPEATEEATADIVAAATQAEESAQTATQPPADPAVSAAQDPAIDIPVGDGDQSPGRPRARPAGLGPDN